MSLSSLAKIIPDYAVDLRNNLQALAQEEILTPQQKAGAFLVASMAVRNGTLLRHLQEEFVSTLSKEALEAVKVIASIMPVYNLYYRFAGLSGVEEYADMTLKMRLSSLSKIQVPDMDSELWIVTISAVNACALCIKSHEPAAREAGASAQQIQAVVRIAALIYAIATVLDSAQALAAQPVLDGVA